MAQKKEKRRAKHLYVDKSGEYPCKLNRWEEEVLEAALATGDAVAWLRNVPRQEWSFVVPYEHNGEDNPLYPDFLVFRRAGKGFLVDVLEPHSASFADGWAKAVGLAKFARDHGDKHFGRIELITKLSGLKRLDVNDASTRAEVLAVQTNQHLVQLFERA